MTLTLDESESQAANASPELRFSPEHSAFRPVSTPEATSAEAADAKEARRERKRKAEESGDLSGCGNCEPARRWKSSKADDDHDPYQCPLCLRTTANSPAVVSCRCSGFQRYHIGCFAQNLKTITSCPLCRSPLSKCWIVGVVQIYDTTAIKDYCIQQSIDEYRRWSTFLSILFKLKTYKSLVFDLKETGICGVYRVPQLVQTILTQFTLVTFSVDQIVSAWETFLKNVKRDVAKMEKKLKMTKLFLQHECSC